MDPFAAQPDPMTPVLATFRRQEATDWGNAWVGMEPTFQTKKSVRKWSKMAAKHGGEDAYFTCSYMLKTQKKVAEAIQRKYEAKCKAGIHRSCMFAQVKLDDDLDQWQMQRQNLLFHWPDDQFGPTPMTVPSAPPGRDFRHFGTSCTTTGPAALTRGPSAYSRRKTRTSIAVSARLRHPRRAS